MAGARVPRGAVLRKGRIMKTGIGITLVICGVFLLLTPQLMPLFAEAGDVKSLGPVSAMVPVLGVVMIAAGTIGPWLGGRGKSA